MDLTDLRKRLSANVSRWSMIYEPRLVILTAFMLSSCVMFLIGSYAQLQLSANLSSYTRWCQAIARGSGSLLNLFSCVVMLTSCRSVVTIISGLRPFRGINIVKEITTLHSMIGISITIFGVLHTVSHMMWLIPVNSWSDGLWKTKMVVSTGACLIPVVAILIFSSLTRHRQSYYRACKMAHISGCVGYFLVLILHGVHNKRPETYKYLAPVLVLFLLDRGLAKSRTVDCHVIIGAKDIEGVGRNVMKITMPKPFNFRSGQYVEIMVRAISLEWHAFTIASAPHENVLTLYMKRCGDWTESLYNILRNELLNREKACVELKVRGPFGAPAQVARYYRRLLMVSGGIGATPFVSVCKEIMHKWQAKREADPTMTKSSRWFVQKPPHIYRTSNCAQTDLALRSGQDKLVQLPRSHNFSSSKVFLFILLIGKLFLRIASTSLCTRYSYLNCSWKKHSGPTGIRFLIANIIMELLIVGCFGTYAFLLLKGQVAYKARVCALVFMFTAIFSMVLDIHSRPSITQWTTVEGFLQTVIVPLLQIGLAIFLNLHFKRKHCSESGLKCPVVDFVWVVSNCEEDEWIQNELSIFQSTGPVRLRRFLTRQAMMPSRVQSQRGSSMQSRDSEVITNLGRPDWNALLSGIAADTRSNEKIGLIFCGPTSMGDQIRHAAKAVSVASQLRDARVHCTAGLPRTTHDQSKPQNYPALELGHGRNVIFDVHQEIFI